MRLLITGGTGFIGAQLAREARACGHDIIVTGLMNNAAERQRADRLEADGIGVVEGSLRVPSFTRRIVEGCDAVIHLAAAQHAVNVPDDYFFDVNVEATRILLESCVRARVRRFVYGSTIGVYGAPRGGALTEDSPIAPDNVYGASKAAAEKVVRSFDDRLETTIIRIGETYGPEDLRLLKLFKMAQRGMSLILGGGRNLHQPIHVHDLVRALLLVAEHPAAKGETFVVAGPSPITTREMLSAICEAMDSQARRFSLPLFPALVAARIVESACKRLLTSPPIYMRRLDFFRKSLAFQTTKARTALGYTPHISFRMGVRDTFKWYSRTGYLTAARAQVTPVTQRSHDAALQTSRTDDVPLATFSGSDWRLSDILDYTNDAIIVWEMGGAGILYWNRAAERLYGYTRQEALGRTTHVLLRTQLEGGVDELEGKVSRYGVWGGYIRHRRRDGGSVLVDARLSLMARRDGRWLVLEVNREVGTTAERQNLAAELSAHIAHLRQSSEAQDAAPADPISQQP